MAMIIIIQTLIALETIQSPLLLHPLRCYPPSFHSANKPYNLPCLANAAAKETRDKIGKDAVIKANPLQGPYEITAGARKD